MKFISFLTITFLLSGISLVLYSTTGLKLDLMNFIKVFVVSIGLAFLIEYVYLTSIDSLNRYSQKKLKNRASTYLSMIGAQKITLQSLKSKISNLEKSLKGLSSLWSQTIEKNYRLEKKIEILKTELKVEAKKSKQADVKYNKLISHLQDFGTQTEPDKPVIEPEYGKIRAL